MMDPSNYLQEAEKYALQAMEAIADQSADPQKLQRANVMASIAVFLELRATRVAATAAHQSAIGIVNDRSDLPFRMTSLRRTVRDQLR